MKSKVKSIGYEKTKDGKYILRLNPMKSKVKSIGYEKTKGGKYILRLNPTNRKIRMESFIKTKPMPAKEAIYILSQSTEYPFYAVFNDKREFVGFTYGLISDMVSLKQIKEYSK